MPPSGTFVSVSTSDGFACAVRTDGTLACWGDNSSSQATPPPGADFVSVGAGQHFACAVRTNGTIACWGMNTSGEATPPAW
jgi:alpha-tubulin suppressor-like RCC1 family protein